MEGREGFTWQNEVPTHTRELLWCKVLWPHRHKSPSRENNSVLAGERTIQPKTCAVFLWLFMIHPTEDVEPQLYSRKTGLSMMGTKHTCAVPSLEQHSLGIDAQT